MAKYFGTNGVRGRFDELTPQLALQLSQAIGRYLGAESSSKILVARDCRLTGECLKNAVISGLSSVGCDVIDLGIVSSPTAEFMIRKLQANGLIIVTASHNPPEWNALKVVDGKGIAISCERGEGIEKLMRQAELATWDKVDKIAFYDRATRDHIEAIKVHIRTDKLKKKKVVLDCGNGTACFIAPQLFRELGAEVLTINSHPDGRFPGRPSEPTQANVKDLISAVKANKADAGIAWDGDGDRVIFVAKNGQYIIGDKVYALSVLWKLNEKKGGIVTTVATSKAVEDVAKSFGCAVKYTAIGVPYLAEAMKVKNTKGEKEKFVLGGEEVGGVIWPELSLAKDGFLTAAKMYEKLAFKSLGQWLEDVPKYYNVKTKIEADKKKKQVILERVLEYVRKNKSKAKVEVVDGVRINFDDCWIIVRASGTENYIRVFAEAKSEQMARKLLDEYLKITTSH